MTQIAETETIGRTLHNKHSVLIEIGNNGFTAYLDGGVFADSSSVSTLEKVFAAAVKAATGAKEVQILITFPKDASAA